METADEFSKFWKDTQKHLNFLKLGNVICIAVNMKNPSGTTTSEAFDNDCVKPIMT